MTEATIKSGDTYTSLAKTYNITAKDIQNANPGVNPKKLQIGQKITIPIINNIDTSDKSVDIKKTEKQIKENKFLDTINKHLDIPNYETSVIELKGNKFLRLYRRIDDEYLPEKRHFMDLDSIKENLLIKDGVLQKYNDMVRVTNSRCWNDDNTIDPGQTLDIPVSEIGQKKGGLFGAFESDKNKELKQAVKDLLN